MITDPIVEEIHKTRERLLQESDGDLHKLVESYRTAESQHQGRLVSFGPVHVVGSASDTGDGSAAPP